MAIAIKSIPVLKETAAESFQKRITINSKKRASINFSKELEAAKMILLKSKK